MLETDTSSQEIEKRLDELFTDTPSEKKSDEISDGLLSTEGLPPEKPSAAALPQDENRPEDTVSNVRKNRPLSLLKSIILSMDWEITDAILVELLQELDRLKTVLKQDVIAVRCLQLLEALGKYIQKKKARTHPDSVKLLQSIYRDLEIMLLSGGISNAAKRTILIDEINQFKELKAKLQETSRRTPPKALPFHSRFVSESEDEPEKLITSADSPDYERLRSHEAFRCTLEEIKKTLHSEFSALRTEIQLWRNDS